MNELEIAFHQIGASKIAIVLNETKTESVVLSFQVWMHQNHLISRTQLHAIIWKFQFCAVVVGVVFV